MGGTTDSRFLLVARLLLALAFIGFYGFITLSVLNRVTEFPNGVKEVAMFLLGALTTSVVTVVGFFFSSSQSSAAKNELLKEHSR